MNCTATDFSGNTAPGSFSVVVKGAAAQMTDLVVEVNGFDFSQGLQTSLDAKRQAAISFPTNSTSASCFNSCVPQSQSRCPSTIA